MIPYRRIKSISLVQVNHVDMRWIISYLYYRSAIRETLQAFCGNQSLEKKRFLENRLSSQLDHTYLNNFLSVAEKGLLTAFARFLCQHIQRFRPYGPIQELFHNELF